MTREYRHKAGMFLLVTLGLLFIVFAVGIKQSGASAVFPSPSPIANAPEGWVVECVDCLHYFTGMSGSSAALDSSGFVHTVYGGDGLYYAIQNPDDTFQIEVIDDNPYRGLNAAMVLDSADRPHILYYAADLLRLIYAHFDGGQWQIAALLSGGDVGSYASLAMPYAGYPMIIYYDAVHHDLMGIYRPFQPTHFAFTPTFAVE